MNFLSTILSHCPMRVMALFPSPFLVEEAAVGIQTGAEAAQCDKPVAVLSGLLTVAGV